MTTKVTPELLSTGAPTWDTAGYTTVAGSAAIQQRIQSSATGGPLVGFHTGTGSYKGFVGTSGGWVGDTSMDMIVASNASGGKVRFFVNGSATDAAQIDSSGNFMVGATSSSSKLSVTDMADRTEATAQFMINANGYAGIHWLNGTAYYIGQNSAARELRMYAGATPTTGVKLTNGATSWAATSDEREKDIIEPIANAAEKVAGLRAVIGKYKTDADEVRRSFLIAQDVQAVLPEAVNEDADGLLSLRYTDVIPLLVKAIQELKTELDELKAKAN